MRPLVCTRVNGNILDKTTAGSPKVSTFGPPDCKSSSAVCGPRTETYSAFGFNACLNELTPVPTTTELLLMKRPTDPKLTRCRFGA